MRGRGLETCALVYDGQQAQVKLLRELNDSLHALSQPMTVLLCTLEYGVGSGSLAEMKEAVMISQEACERLRKTVLAMQMQVRVAMEEGRSGE